MHNLYNNWLKNLVAAPIAPGLTLPHPNLISIDSRTIKAGEWFMPLVGDNFDGHTYINETVRKTGAGFFYDPAKKAMISPELLPSGLAVHSTLKSLQAIGLGWRQQQENLTVVALTGSVGKTTTRDFAKAIFSSQGKTQGTLGNFNNEIGLPLTLLKIQEDDRFSILELGARHVGDIAFLSKISDPDIVACLNVGVSHLGEFGSPENLFAAKMEIFDNEIRTITRVSPRDDSRIEDYVQKFGKNRISFGYNGDADVKIMNYWWLKKGGMEIEISAHGVSEKFTLGLGHEAYPINVCAAVAMAIAAGLSISKLKDCLRSFTGLPGRYNLLQLPEKTLIDDCYNAAPQSMKAGISSVAQGFRGREKVLVLGDMLELGPTSDEIHFDLGRELSDIISVSLLVTVGESAKIIGKGALSQGLLPSRLLSFSTVDELIASKDQVLAGGEVVYVKASNGVGLKKFVEHMRQER